jgi:hypothetical protein
MDYAVRGTVSAVIIQDGCCSLRPQAAKEQAQFAQELQEETDKLVLTYELALKEGAREREVYANRIDILASESAINKAKTERAELLAGVLKTRVVRQHIDNTRVACKLISAFVAKQRTYESELSSLRQAMEQSGSVTHKMVTMRTAIEEALQANKQEILLEVRSSSLSVRRLMLPWYCTCVCLCLLVHEFVVAVCMHVVR